jgi:20S proteasome alpha/beta subunit
MTLIVSIKTDDFIVMAADGMAYTRPQAGAATPYETQKLHIANVSWIIGFARWAGIEVQHQELESQIEMGVMDFDSDVRIGGPAYLEALRTLLKKSGGKSEPSVVRLAGFDRNGNPRVYEVVFPDGQLYPAANASACGVPAAATAQWIKPSFCLLSLP